MTNPDILWSTLPDGRLVVQMRNDAISRSFTALTMGAALSQIVSVGVSEFRMDQADATAMATGAVSSYEASQARASEHDQTAAALAASEQQRKVAEAAVHLLASEKAALEAELAAVRSAVAAPAAGATA